MSTGSYKHIRLKELASLLELSPATVSRIVNGQGDKFRIAKQTQLRVLEAAEQHGYTANGVARSLRDKRTYTIGVIVPEISDGYSTTVLSGIEDELLKEEFFYFVVSHRHLPEHLERYPRLMLSRSVEGIIAVDTHIPEQLPVPVVAVSGHRRRTGVVNIQVNHHRAAELGLSHLQSLGHERIAFIKGQPFSSDTASRWQAITETAKKLGIIIDAQLVVQLQSQHPGPEPGREAMRVLIQKGLSFTAVFAFNDISAIGAILALRQQGLRVPRDVSVLGFDDIMAASTNSPALTTIHQPLRGMGQLAAGTMVRLIRNESLEMPPETLRVEPSLVIRESTAMVSWEQSAARRAEAAVELEDEVLS